jgi:hypothetical protein
VIFFIHNMLIAICGARRDIDLRGNRVASAATTTATWKTDNRSCTRRSRRAAPAKDWGRPANSSPNIPTSSSDSIKESAGIADDEINR